MSGNSLCPWALQKKPGENVVRLGKAIGCLDESATDMDDAAYQCLRDIDAETLTTSWTGAFQVSALNFKQSSASSLSNNLLYDFS